MTDGTAVRTAPAPLLFRTHRPVAHVQGGGIVLEHGPSGSGMMLNGTARRLWELTDAPITFDALCARVAGEFEIGPDECGQAVRAFLGDLARRGLVDEVDEAPGDAGVRSRYLDLLKRALVNLIYPEHELRIELLEEQGRPRGLEGEQLMRDIRYREPAEYEELVASKVDGSVRRRRPSRFSHTMVGMERLDNLEYCARRVFADGVPGDFLEAGVCQGGAAIFMRGLQVALGEENRRVWLADSFEGLPPPTHEVDRAWDLDWSEERQPWLACDLDAVQDNFRTYGLLDEGVRWLRGWFSETLPTAPVERLAILRADADLYQSTREILDSLYHRVSPGGFVVIDDYGAIDACRRAVDEFRAEHGIIDPIRRIDWTGVYWRREA
ncbi:MAG TPA: PqqD family peptide modification chaperone [Longimicrobium sp.]